MFKKSIQKNMFWNNQPIQTRNITLSNNPKINFKQIINNYNKIKINNKLIKINDNQKWIIIPPYNKTNISNILKFELFIKNNYTDNYIHTSEELEEDFHHGFIIMLEEEDKVIGSIRGVPVKMTFEKEYKDFIYVDYLCILKERRNMNLAGKLIAKTTNYIQKTYKTPLPCIFSNGILIKEKKHQLNSFFLKTTIYYYEILSSLRDKIKKYKTNDITYYNKVSNTKFIKKYISSFKCNMILNPHKFYNYKGVISTNGFIFGVLKEYNFNSIKKMVFEIKLIQLPEKKQETLILLYNLIINIPTINVIMFNDLGDNLEFSFLTDLDYIKTSKTYYYFYNLSTSDFYDNANIFFI